MQTSDLARRVMAALSIGPASLHNEAIPCDLLDRHAGLQHAWQSWREHPARLERATALRVALDEALGRDPELRTWAWALTREEKHRAVEPDSAEPVHMTPVRPRPTEPPPTAFTPHD